MKDRNSDIPLHCACGSGHKGIVRLLVKHGADDRPEAHDLSRFNVFLMSLAKSLTVHRLALNGGELSQLR